MDPTMSTLSKHLTAKSENAAARCANGHGVCELHHCMGSRMCSFHTFLSLVNQLRQLESYTVRHDLIMFSLERHRTIIEQREIPYLRRFYFEAGDDYPYRSHGQPFTAFASLAGCLFILIVTDGAALWIKFRLQPFLSAYLSVRQPRSPLRKMRCF